VPRASYITEIAGWLVSCDSTLIYTLSFYRAKRRSRDSTFRQAMKRIENNSLRQFTDWQVRLWKSTVVYGRPAWVWGIIAIGAFLRTAQYWCGRSLWNDEAEFALNILHRPFGGLFSPLQYHQGAPIGFLLLEKLATVLGGKGEIALRAVPFIAGVVALLVFYDVAKLYLSPAAVPIALTLFSLSRSLVYYSSEAKQYSTDVLVTLILLQSVYRLREVPLSLQELVGIGALGAVGIWFSHPASFVLAGAAAVLIVDNLVRRNTRGLGGMIWVFAAWVVSFGVCYVVSLRALSHDDALLEYWHGNFAPHDLSSIVPWASYNFLAAFENPGPLNSIMGACFFVAGCGRLLRGSILRFSLLATPLLALFLASVLHLYPLYGRLLLFLCPILLLLVSEGAIWVYNATQPLSPVLGAALIALLLAKPIYLAADTLIHPIHAEDIKAGVRYIESRQWPGDRWYAYYGAKYQLAYYAEVYALPLTNVLIGSDCGTDKACYGSDVNPLRGSSRVWVLLSHVLPHDGGNEGSLLREQLDMIGTRVDGFDDTGVTVYLYNLDHPATIVPSDR
jgi:hypothetical protein